MCTKMMTNTDNVESSLQLRLLKSSGVLLQVAHVEL